MPDAPNLPPLPDLPDAVKHPVPPVYVPAQDWAAWLQANIIASDGPLANEDHERLSRADFGVLMTNEGSSRKGRQILGTAALAEPSGSDDWGKGMKRQQLQGFFGDVPDFLFRFDAAWIHEQAKLERPAAILALLEHELYHCRQDTDAYGAPAFNQATGKPKWAMRPHDVEEFVGVARRYGAGAPADATAQLVAAAAAGPEVAPARLDGLCGTCGRSL